MRKIIAVFCLATSVIFPAVADAEYSEKTSKYGIEFRSIAEETSDFKVVSFFKTIAINGKEKSPPVYRLGLQIPKPAFDDFDDDGVKYIGLLGPFDPLTVINSLKDSNRFTDEIQLKLDDTTYKIIHLGSFTGKNRDTFLILSLDKELIEAVKVANNAMLIASFPNVFSYEWSIPENILREWKRVIVSK